jgi:dipeptidyl aminopeptidase/acylaminoacyl peptidase
VVGYSWVGQQGEQRFLDPALEAARTAAVAAFSPDPLVFVTWSRDRSRILFYGEQGLDGGAYYVFTTATQRVERLAHLYPELATLNNGERQAITYAARDRTRIPAYLTLPVREGNAPLPLVVLVHGGPNARDTFDFDWWATFLASRGYAVLQPNYRGSGGYGASWEQAGWTQWGGLMQTDVEDGVAALIRNGIADPARVCIVGASYGGYAALAGATLTPDRYRCAASIAGVSDLPAMLDQVAAQTRDNSIASDYWRLSMGDRRESRDQLRAVSPAYLADRVRIPVLLIHGTYDTVVPIEQSHRMRRALEAAGKTTRFVELEGDDHWLSDAETRTQMLRELETFLAQHLGTR